MAWLRFSDDYNRKPEIRALDDGSYRAFACLIEAAEHFDACGMVPDDYVMTAYPHARQKLRREVRKLADRGLAHLLIGPDDHDPECASCQIRQEELKEEGGEELRKNWGTSSAPSTQSRKTEPMYICIPHFFDVAMTPEAKRLKKQGDAERQQRKRDKDKAASSRRDAQPPSRPPVPVPVPDPKLKINDLIAPEEQELPSTADPSEPSSGTTDRDAVSWLRKELDQRRTACRVSCKWKPEYQTHLEGIVRQASEAEGDTFKVLTGGMDAFFKDPGQRKWRFAPPGLDWGFAEYAAPILEQENEEAKARKIADKTAEYERIRDEYAERDWRQKQAKKQEREQNGTSRSSTPGGNLATDLQEWK
jgi:hypothetical protein